MKSGHFRFKNALENLKTGSKTHDIYAYNI